MNVAPGSRRVRRPGSAVIAARATAAAAAAIAALALLLPASAPAQEEINHPELEWKTIETEHFLVHYHDGTERTARATAKIAEEIYGPVNALYNHEPDTKVSFVIKDYDDYSNGAAYFFDNKIEIWASSLDTDLRGTHNWLRNVITHEYTHIVQIQTSFKFGRTVPAVYFQWLGYEAERRQDVLYGYPNTIVSYPISGFVIPSWFAEGVAQFNRKELAYDYWDSHRDMILRCYAIDGNMLTWNEMSVFGKTSLGNESSYNAGFSFVSYIVDRFGDGALEKISRSLSSFTTVTIDAAIGDAVGIDGAELYLQWQESLRQSYLTATAGVRASPVAGDTIGAVGFANLHPVFSPDGSTVAYISNKTGDYFSSSSLYLYDVAAKKERELVEGVRSKVSWTPDGKRIYFARHSRDNDFWSNYSDLYYVDVATGEETRLTHGIRANAPAVSPDGSRIAWVRGSDGTLNLWVSDPDGKNATRLTSYAKGEQVYNPVWSPDGKEILFDYSVRDGRDIYAVPASGGEPAAVIATSSDERTASFDSAGRILHASDRTGIFNIYALDRAEGTTEQLTNVVGGAFMPAAGPGGSIAYSLYTSGGYKLARLAAAAPLPNPPVYVRNQGFEKLPAKVELAYAGGGGYDWGSLRKYDDDATPPLTDGSYKSTATSLTVIPFLRVDNYNPENEWYQNIRPGAYLYSYDMLDQYGFFAGAALNTKLERDLFFTFDFRGRVPGLYDLGWAPTMQLEAYNTTRETESFVALPLDTIGVGVTYNLLEFGVHFTQPIFTEYLTARYGYTHSRYAAEIDEFYVEESELLVQATSVTYLKGNQLRLGLEMDARPVTRTSEINPVGTKAAVTYDYEFNKFDPTDTVNDQGQLIQAYRDVNFHRLDLMLRHGLRLPGWKHALSVTAKAGTIFGPAVDDFFDFYIGGLIGMKGYPFYSLGGNEYGFLNLTYRFPIWERIDIRFLQFYFDKLYGAVYADAGAVWTGGGPVEQPVRKDAGFELRLETFSFYAFPTRVFFNATYGFDTFSRYDPNTGTVATYGREWQYHFGVLFGFEFD